MQFLVRSKERMKLVLQYIKKDLKNGRKIVIPVMYKKQAFDLVERIREMGYKAEAFVAGVDREDLLKRARAGKIDVVVGIRSILSTGVNVPIWSAIYTIAPISNPPNYYQETMRVCTPMEGKMQPIIRIFVDDMPMTKGCFRTCWFQTVVKHGFEFNDRHKEKARLIINSMGSSRQIKRVKGKRIY
jgi:superfamily II DNA or RNA helicase